MTQRKNLGDILLESGRVTQEQVDQALEYQRTHGGYFGQALVAQGFVRAEEVEWALANQFDLPLIFPDPDTVDPDAAALVTADWALTNLAVPIVRTGDTLTVVVENPLDQDVIADLHQRTGLEIDVALASPSRIRELVHALYGDAAVDAAVENRVPVSLDDFIGEALDGGAERVGVSARGTFAMAWHARGGDSRVRRRLAPGWRDVLAELVEPWPAEQVTAGGQQVKRWTATLRRGEEGTDIDARLILADSGFEFVLQPFGESHGGAVPHAEATIPPAIIAELRVLGRAGIRVALVAEDAEMGASILPRLPRMVWGDEVRAAHLTTEPASPGTFTLSPESPSDELLDALEEFRFDALTVDLPADYPLERVLGAAPNVIARLDEAGDDGRLERLGIGWVLRTTDGADWRLDAVRD